MFKVGDRVHWFARKDDTGTVTGVNKEQNKYTIRWDTNQGVTIWWRADVLREIFDFNDLMKELVNG